MAQYPINPGCIVEPEPAGMPSIEATLGAAELPEQYIVPSWRECFDSEFNPIFDKISPRILNQGQLDTCVGHGVSVMKTAQEHTTISPRDIWRLAKRKDGYPLEMYGTTGSAALDALADTGASEDSLVNRDPSMGREAYLSLQDVTPEVTASRARHKAKKPYFVPRTLMRETLVAHKYPIGTSSIWYPQDNAIGDDGIMQLPQQASSTGHYYACIGFINRQVKGVKKSCLVMVNSFGSDWGAGGLFFIPLDGTENRLSNSAVSIDISSDLADILAQYNNKNVASIDNSPDRWRIEGGVRRPYPDEIVWWAHGNLFGFDVYDISKEDLELVPLGPPMSIEDAPFKTKELVRQIRQYYGHL